MPIMFKPETPKLVDRLEQMVAEGWATTAEAQCAEELRNKENQIETLRDERDELGADKGRYYRLYEAACIELQAIKAIRDELRNSRDVLTSELVRITDVRDELTQALREVRFNVNDPEIVEKTATAAISKVEGGAL